MLYLTYRVRTRNKRSNMRNIVLIMADQLRKDCLGCYGNKYANTPNIDHLASKSLVFDRSYVANPICSPNRMSIFTGRYPSNHGLWTNGVLAKKDSVTIAEHLSANGWQTASIGKIHFNPYSAESKEFSLESVSNWDQMPTESSYDEGYFGFQHVELTLGHTLAKSHYLKWFKEKGGSEKDFEITALGTVGSGDSITGIRNMPASLSSSAFVGERAVEYLKHGRSKDKPFFLSVSFPDPHHPFTACKDSYEKWKKAPYKKPCGSADDLKTRPEHYREHFLGMWTRKGLIPKNSENGVPADESEIRIRNTYAMIEEIDRNVGLVLDELEKQGLMDDTIIIFTSDHGELLGDHGLWLKGPFFYEGLISTPLMISGKNIPSRRCSALFSSVDVAPTLLDVLGMAIPADIDGISQKEVLENKANELRKNCIIEYRNGYNCDCNVNALITKDYKFVQYENGDQEYTDLAFDPYEKTNQIGNEAYKEKIHEAEKILLIEKLKNKNKGDKQYGHA